MRRRTRAGLRPHPLGVAEDEDLAARQRRRQREPPQQQPYGADVVTREARRRLVQRPFAPRRQLVSERFRDQLHLLVRVRALLRQLDGNEPMDVGVRQAQYQLAVLASPTPFALPLVPVFAYQRLGEPRSEEHTSELQSPCNLVCRLLLEKKKK